MMDRLAHGVVRRGLSSMVVGPTAANVRKTFLEYFQRDHNHLLIPSSPLMPNRDVTLSFVNAGMNQFKGVFLGDVVPASKRVVNSQKCVRIKGKHNDMDQVGLDGTHHTFFEMLGNWSFDDYYKKEACLMAWNLLTDVYKIPPGRLYVTYFKGDEELGLSPDLETKEIWSEIGVPENRILPFGMTDNFWEMAAVGPCGPCTEIHYDHVPGRNDASSLVNAGHPLVTELWNLVFMDFNRTADSKLESLGKKFVDTGMGYERLVAVLQGQTSNYETDLFKPLFDVIQRSSGRREYTATYGDDTLDVAYRKLADHARMVTVTLSDGITPNVNPRVRAVFRKAFTLQRSEFGVATGLVKELSNHVAEMLSPVYPEIGRNLKRVQWLIDEEENVFIEREKEGTANWLKFLREHPRFKSIETELKDEYITAYNYLEKHVLQKSKSEITTEQAWRLFDSLGMTLENIRKFCKILGLSFNEDEFAEYRKTVSEKARIQAEEKYRQHRITSRKPQQTEIVGLATTDDKLKYQYEVDVVTGNYELPEIPVTILSVIVDGQVVDKVDKEMLEGNKPIGLVLDRTTLFHETAESVSDAGVLSLADSVVLKIFKAVKVGNQLIHNAIFETVPESHDFTVQNRGTLRLSGTRRQALLRANTAALVFKSMLHNRMNFFCESSTKVDYDTFKISFCGYPMSFKPRDFMEMEKEMTEALKVAEPVERKWCTVSEIREMDDLMIRPGDTFIEAETPIARVHTPWMTARFRADVPLARHVFEVEDFVIVDYERIGYRIMEMTCLTGEKVSVAKANSAKYAEIWNEIRDFHVVSADNEEIAKKMQCVQQFLKELTKLKFISYYVKQSIMEEAAAKVVLLNKHSRSRVRASRKAQREWTK